MSHKPVSKLSRDLPFRLGCTSYVIPDEITPNVEKMAPLVDDIELVLFETPGYSNLPSLLDLEQLSVLLDSNDTTVTIHLPTDQSPFSDFEAFVHSMHSVISLCSRLSPFAYIFHLEGFPGTSWGSEFLDWRRCYEKALDCILDSSSIDPKLIAIENLAYPPSIVAPFVQRFHTSHCVDIGHLWVHFPGTWRDELRACLDCTRVVHLHGVEGTKDHVSLEKSGESEVTDLCSILKRYDYRNVVTLEVFNEIDTFESIDMMRSVWHQ